jgi:hypothetical protein
MSSFKDLQIRDKLIIVDRGSAMSDTPSTGYAYFYTYDNKFYIKKSDDTILQFDALGDYVDYVPQDTAPSYNEGRVWYDNLTKALTLFIDSEDVQLNLGREILIRVKNTTGSTIQNGSVVYPSGVDNGVITVELADASAKNKCRLIAVATEDILPEDSENDGCGYVARLGQVNEVDTSAFASGGIVYLSPTTPGALTQTRPTDGHFVVIVGAVSDVNATTGSIVVDPNIADLTVEVTDTNGFPISQREGTTLSFADSSREFIISPDGSSFYYYQEGQKFEQTNSQSVIITDTEGIHFIYFDGLTLTAVTNPTDSQIEAIVLSKVLVAFVYWDAANNTAIFVGDERHGISMAPYTHLYLHTTVGARYLNGLALNSIITGAAGDLDAHAQFGIDAGEITDEDLKVSISAINSAVGLPIYYLSGSGAALRRVINTGFSITTAGSGRMAYNEYTGTAWQLTEVGNNDYALCHVFATNEKDTPIIAIVGQNTYDNASAAQIGANNEILNIIGQLPQPEIVPIATVIFQTSNNYNNGAKSRIIQTSEGEDYVNWTQSELNQASAPTNHANLANLQGGAAGELFHATEVQAAKFPYLVGRNRITVEQNSDGTIDLDFAGQNDLWVSGGHSAGGPVQLDTDFSLNITNDTNAEGVQMFIEVICSDGIDFIPDTSMIVYNTIDGSGNVNLTPGQKYQVVLMKDTVNYHVIISEAGQ